MSGQISRRRAAGLLGGAATSLLVGEAHAEHANVAERVTQLIVKHMGVARERIKPEATFAALGADSLDCIELVMASELEFNIIVDDNVAARLKTVGEMIQHIEASPKAPPPPPRKK